MIDEYQEFTDTTAIYPRHDRKQVLAYLSLGLCSEAGEVAGKVKKLIRDGDETVSSVAIAFELGDVLWYAAQLATELGVRLSDVLEDNKGKLLGRKSRGTLGGSGDTR